MKRKYLLICLYLFACSSAQAQFHFQGLKGITVAYGISSDLDRYLSLGYQSFLGDRFQMEILGAFGQGSLLDSAIAAPYKVALHQHQRQMMLHETVDYSFLRLFRRVYVNAGVGLTQVYAHPVVKAMYPTLDTALLESAEDIPAFDERAIRLPDQISLGGHASMLSEIYLSRYITLLARYRYTWFLQSRGKPTRQQTTVGLRFNF